MTRLSLAAAIVLSMLPGAAQDPKPRAWPRVKLGDPGTRLFFERSLDRVARRLSEPRCQSVFTTFRDKSGRPLSTRLSELRTTPVEYLRLITFVEGGRCGGEIAYTQPGSLTVKVCARQFEATWWRNAGHAEAAIIHEALHTLGLGENPPTSGEITGRVRRACDIE